MDDFEIPNARRAREASVEDAVIAWAEENGWFSRFMKYRGRNGCRDVDFYGYGQIVMVEFKRPGRGTRGLSGNQVSERRRMKAAGLTVHVVDSIAQGIAILREAMKRTW